MKKKEVVEAIRKVLQIQRQPLFVGEIAERLSEQGVVVEEEQVATAIKSNLATGKKTRRLSFIRVPVGKKWGFYFNRESIKIRLRAATPTLRKEYDLGKEKQKEVFRKNIDERKQSTHEGQTTDDMQRIEKKYGATLVPVAVQRTVSDHIEVARARYFDMTRTKEGRVDALVSILTDLFLHRDAPEKMWARMKLAELVADQC